MGKNLLGIKNNILHLSHKGKFYPAIELRKDFNGNTRVYQLYETKPAKLLKVFSG